MKKHNILAICLALLALHGKAWAEIYETTDAEGNPEFTDSPPTENAEVIDVGQTNTADAPAPEQQEDVQDGAVEQPAAVVPVEQNNVVIERGVNDGEVYPDGVYPAGVYRDGEYPVGVDEEALRRDDAVERADPDAPREVGDAQSQMPHEVGDSEAQMPREVGDSESQMPHEVGDAVPAGVHRR